jgi:hypothetical protein
MTAVDRRVLILQELESLLTGMTIPLMGTGISNGSTPSEIPPGNFVRNRNELPAGKVPGIILLDGDEVPDPNIKQIPQGRETNVFSPQIMRMSPEIYVVLDVRKPANLNVGEDLSIARAAILKAIMLDGNLHKIVGSHGKIVYDGCVTDLARNRTMQGQMGLLVSFVYPFIPGEIAE